MPKRKKTVEKHIPNRPENIHKTVRLPIANHMIVHPVLGMVIDIGPKFYSHPCLWHKDQDCGLRNDMLKVKVIVFKSIFFFQTI